MTRKLTNLIGTGLIAGSGLFSGCQNTSDEQIMLMGLGMLGAGTAVSPYTTATQKVAGTMLNTGAGMASNVQANQAESNQTTREVKSEGVGLVKAIKYKDGTLIFLTDGVIEFTPRIQKKLGEGFDINCGDKYMGDCLDQYTKKVFVIHSFKKIGDKGGLGIMYTPIK